MPDEPQPTIIATGTAGAVASAVSETTKTLAKAEPIKIVLICLGVMMLAWIGMMFAGGFIFLRLLENERMAATRIIQVESEKNRVAQVEAARILAASNLERDTRNFEFQKGRDQSMEMQWKVHAAAISASVGMQGERLIILMTKLETAMDRLNRKFPEVMDRP